MVWYGMAGRCTYEQKIVHNKNMTLKILKFKNAKLMRKTDSESQEN